MRGAEAADATSQGSSLAQTRRRGAARPVRGRGHRARRAAAPRSVVRSISGTRRARARSALRALDAVGAEVAKFIHARPRRTTSPSSRCDGGECTYDVVVTVKKRSCERRTGRSLAGLQVAGPRRRAQHRPRAIADPLPCRPTRSAGENAVMGPPPASAACRSPGAVAPMRRRRAGRVTVSVSAPRRFFRGGPERRRPIRRRGPRGLDVFVGIGRRRGGGGGGAAAPAAVKWRLTTRGGRRRRRLRVLVLVIVRARARRPGAPRRRRARDDLGRREQRRCFRTSEPS